MRFKVLVDDNFHFAEEGERDEAATYDTADAAVAHARRIVDNYLAKSYKPGMTADALYDDYTSFGDDPFIRCDAADVTVAFSAWTYAKERCGQICGGSVKA